VDNDFDKIVRAEWLWEQAHRTQIEIDRIENIAEKTGSSWYMAEKTRWLRFKRFKLRMFKAETAQMEQEGTATYHE